MRVAVLGTGMVGRAIAGKLSELGYEVGDHTVFVSGDDPEAKALVTGLLTEGFGWRDVVDLGDITTASRSSAD